MALVSLLSGIESFMGKVMPNKFKIEIHTNRQTPIVTDNPVLTYVLDQEIDELFVKVYYAGIEIGQGIILDFYKEFTNIESNGLIQTHIKTFPFHDKTKQKYTNFGNKIYQIKYLKSPPIPKPQRDNYIVEFTNAINHYMPSLKEINNDLKIAYIPSSTNTPEDIAILLSQFSSLELTNIIAKNTQNPSDGKNITDFALSMEHARNKYVFDEAYLKANADAQYIVIDDVMGNSSTILTVLKKLHEINEKVNYFFIVVKDVKR
jgi:hypothetical protein